jgi:cephalosporin-C deacetylase-like acetyl esterase
VNPAGKGADASEGGAIEKLVRAGNVVLAIDPRGWGEAGAAQGPRGGYSKSYQTAMRALLVGKTMAGMQTGDVLRAFDYLRSRRDVDARRIEVLGTGKGGALALFAGVLEPGIASVRCETLPPSYMDLARMKMHDGDMDPIVPGVLRDFDLPDLVAALGPRFTSSPTGSRRTSDTAPNRKR